MTVEVFIFLLTFYSSLTAIIVEVLKNLLDEWKLRTQPNTLAIVTACVVGWLGTLLYYVSCGIVTTEAHWVALFLIGPASGLCSMVGYDKVIQTINQLKR